jgi:hypothetical protein
MAGTGALPIFTGISSKERNPFRIREGFLVAFVLEMTVRISFKEDHE